LIGTVKYKARRAGTDARVDSKLRNNTSGTRFDALGYITGISGIRATINGTLV
jgi:hypothetical protein